METQTKGLIFLILAIIAYVYYVLWLFVEVSQQFPGLNLSSPLLILTIKYMITSLIENIHT